MIRVSNEDFNIDIETKALLEKYPNIGGIVNFVGVVRNVGYDKGIEKNAEYLEFECYDKMAEKKLEELKNKAIEQFGIIDATLIHRIGKLSVGENIVLIIVCAKHRKEAFLACEYLINNLKKEVPIWKKEFSKDGSYWVEQH
ncbi:molybdopterin biosynthesis MoaE protein [Methanococcus vannielii SB]|jgi:molybdopterin synthase catalytic subunit|uniref:Molybdopterin biosynthesis MoaE protein n=1 Tax=Methanococcus vannielii (strain ATCC 35089 / DSM 1224 / JCM 13029 / OCM 148 / SB) TaxID=406327 RepID=A6UPN4_METVS|nr:molybdenum cofactor biosynthesis protein MoaE [Methanococcus vannielii]ABR54456.1 molybdopterin biosynthesis MoaE protein [Methanococcus vannielii SB]